ncbi:colicin transporter [Parasphingorhabdus sp.]|uniref:colicin transporter n=1 Tax=Parasphingorhabdus sp. TaxID=2709688 RepID=UPI003266592A
MKLAAKRLEGIGWLLLVFLVAVLLYPLSLSVATLRSDLARTDQKIVSVKKEIRYLETEFSARANLRQLEQWNKLEYGYVAPKAAQYLEGERALASLGGKVPRGPVKIAMINAMDDVRPAGIIGSVIPTASAQTRSPDGDEASVSVDEESSESDLQQNAQSPSSPKENRTERVASMEKKLLDDGLMRDLTVKADREQTRSNGG